MTGAQEHEGSTTSVEAGACKEQSAQSELHGQTPGSSRSTLFRAGGIASSLAAAAVVWPAAPAGAGPAPFGGPYADNSLHTYISTEGNATQRNNWESYFSGEIGQWDDKTVITADEVPTYTTTTDLYWYVHLDSDPYWDPFPAGTLGVALCMDPIAFNRCERFRIIVNDSANGSTLTQKNITCHESGHTLGFDDGGTDQTSCMDGGNNGLVGPNEVAHVNAYY